MVGVLRAQDLSCYACYVRASLSSFRGGSCRRWFLPRLCLLPPSLEPVRGELPEVLECVGGECMLLLYECLLPFQLP